MDDPRSSNLSYGGYRDLKIAVKAKDPYANQMFVGSTSHRPPNPYLIKELAIKERKSSSQSWWNDPDMKRRKRIAKYKFYALKGKVQASLKKGFRWLKKCTKIHGI